MEGREECGRKPAVEEKARRRRKPTAWINSRLGGGGDGDEHTGEGEANPHVGGPGLELR